MQIDKDVPIPTKKTGLASIPHARTKPLRDLFASMCVGDSSFFPFKSEDPNKREVQRNTLYVLAHRAAAGKYGAEVTFTTRFIKENGVAGFRIWRTS